MNIVVLSGGLSTERNVSLTTGAKVQNALIENGRLQAAFVLPILQKSNLIKCKKPPFWHLRH